MFVEDIPESFDSLADFLTRGIDSFSFKFSQGPDYFAAPRTEDGVLILSIILPCDGNPAISAFETNSDSISHSTSPRFVPGAV